MRAGFHSFVVFAEMRTGSNFLEANLNAFDGVSCLGEAFNPHFIGHPDRTEVLGVTQKQRDRDPDLLLDRIETADGLAGFRYFHDHDARVIDRILADERCAKIVLTRDPVSSYVSWKIARTTGQWKLTDATRRKQALVHFDGLEFADFVQAQTEFRDRVTEKLQVTGQTAFHLRYDDLQSLDIINGLARFLGLSQQLEKLDRQLKVQNPEPLANKVSNPEIMEAVLVARAERDLKELPEFEPRRYAAVPTYVLGAETPLVFLPIRCGPQQRVREWMAALDGVEVSELQTSLSQKQLRQWKRAHPGHRSFTVLRHPVLRAHDAYCRHILGYGPEVFAAIRRTLVQRYDLPIPPDGPDETYDLARHSEGFKAFLRFLKNNLNGQTALRVDPAWCSQAQLLKGFSGFATPDLVVREDELSEVLHALAIRLGKIPPELSWSRAPVQPFDLEEIYDDETEALAAEAYQRDYMIFGFGPLR